MTKIVQPMTARQLALLDEAVSDVSPGSRAIGAVTLRADPAKLIVTHAFFFVKAGGIWNFFNHPEAQAAVFGDVDCIVVAFETRADFLEFVTLEGARGVLQ